MQGWHHRNGSAGSPPEVAGASGDLSVSKPVVEVITLEEWQLDDILNDLFFGRGVRDEYVSAAREHITLLFMRDREGQKIWSKLQQVSGDGLDTTMEDVVRNNPRAAFHFLSFLVKRIRGEVVVSLVGGSSYAFYVALNGKLVPGADQRLVAAAARLVGEGQALSLERARRVLLQCGRQVEWRNIDPPGYLRQPDGTVLDVEAPAVVERVDGAYFEGELGVALSQKDVEFVKEVVRQHQDDWAGAEETVLQSAPLFSALLGNVFPSDKERAQVREAFGALLYPGVLRKAFIIVGEPGIGKSKIKDVLLRVLGSYADSISWSYLFGKEGEKFTGSLKGKYANVISETPEEALRKPELFKQLTGDEELAGRVLYRNPFRFKNVCKHYLFCNSLPVFTYIDDAVADRLYIIHATGSPPQSPQPNLDKEIAAKEGKEVMMWLLLNYMFFKQGGLTFKHAPTQEQVVDEMVKASSNVYSFVEELESNALDFGDKKVVAMFGRGYSCEGTQLYDVYLEWCSQRGEKAQGRNTFYSQVASALMGKVSKVTHPSGKVVFKGLKLLIRGVAAEEELPF